MGNVLCKLGRHLEAIGCFEQALALQPGFLDASFNRALALQSLRRFGEALEAHDHMVAARPDYPRLFLHRAYTLRALNRLEEAQASCERALSATPEDVKALVCMGDILQALFRRDEARAYYARALQLDERFPYLRGLHFGACLASCDWTGFEQQVRSLVEGVANGERCVNPWDFVTVSDSAADQLRCASAFAADRCPESPRPMRRRAGARHERVRLAYLSADFHEHATVCLTAGLFERHDRDRFEVLGISFSPNRASAMRSRVVRAFDRFIDVSAQSDEATAELLRDLEVDIAVDLKGFTGDCRPGILAYRPAPIQVSYLGYPGTMGVPYIDYILADRTVIPEEHRAFYSEHVVYLPDTYQVNDELRPIAAPVPTRAEAGLPENGFVFCAFNNNYKITPALLDLWMRLLRRVEHSVLWLFLGNPQVVRNLRREAELRGVSPERLVFAPRVSVEDHLARHRLADLFLDNLPCNAHTTASDSLRAGLPIVTCLGTTFAGRVCASLLKAVGLPELISTSLGDYEELALRLATDPPGLARVKAKLANNLATAPLFDTDRFRRNIERAYLTMWERYANSQPPQGFSVAAP
jgi:predicted O-linked N-acetylglucosamine transferase (SPINDLY family)